MRFLPFLCLILSEEHSRIIKNIRKFSFAAAGRWGYVERKALSTIDLSVC